VFIAEKLMNYTNLLWIMFILAPTEVKILQAIWYQPAFSVIRIKEAKIGALG